MNEIIAISCCVFYFLFFSYFICIFSSSFISQLLISVFCVCVFCVQCVSLFFSFFFFSFCCCLIVQDSCCFFLRYGLLLDCRRRRRRCACLSPNISGTLRRSRITAAFCFVECDTKGKQNGTCLFLLFYSRKSLLHFVCCLFLCLSTKVSRFLCL